MRLVFRLFCAVAVASSLPPSAQAADANGSAALYGLGGVQCEVVAKNAAFTQDTPLKQALQSWFLGYLSAKNAMIPNVFDLSPISNGDALYSLLYNQCKAQPTTSVQAASDAVINALAVARSSQQTPLVEFKNQFGSFSVRAATVSLMQNELTQLGLFKGYIDGKPTPALQDAIKAFQARKGITATGLPDPQTIIDLLLGPKPQSAKVSR